jgi:hypothetical protein
LSEPSTALIAEILNGSKNRLISGENADEEQDQWQNFCSKDATDRAPRFRWYLVRTLLDKDSRRRDFPRLEVGSLRQSGHSLAQIPSGA